MKRLFFNRIKKKNMNVPNMFRKNRPIRLGIVNSAGGSVLGELCRLQKKVPFELTVITDRECGTENVCKTFGI